MLVLTRTRDESVMINDDVEVRVIDIRGDKVRLGFQAPPSIRIHRREVYDRVREENRASARLSRSDASRAEEAARKERTMDPFLQAAIDEAKLGLSEGGLPIGSVLVRGSEIIGRGHNRRVQHNDPMAHAEIDCLTNAGRQKSYRDCVLYSTLMPCFLCTGAVIQFGIPKVIVGESENFPGGCGRWGTSPRFLRENGVEVIDRRDPECIEMMRTFIREHPGLWNEDIGV